MRHSIVPALLALIVATPAFAQEEINLYSSRHYETDEALYSDFEETSGIKINRIEDSADKLIERMRSEGELSQADVLITVDVGLIQRAEDAGLFQPLSSELVVDVVPENLRDVTDLWTGLTTRARLIFYDKDDVTEPPQTYQDLADPKYKGMVCTRSSSNVYMLSLLASIIANNGEDAAKAWAAGMLANLARDPEGGDTDQLRGLISGECEIALANHYYYLRGVSSEVTGLSEGIDKIGIVFPTRRPPARTSTSPPPASPSMRRTRRTPAPSSSIFSARARRSSSPKATTSSRSWPGSNSRRRSSSSATSGTIRSASPSSAS